MIVSNFAATFVLLVSRHVAHVAAVFASSAPSGLLCDLQKHPAQGVRSTPEFGWIVPPCSRGSDHMQIAYKIQVWSNINEKLVWDSGKVFSNASTHVPYGGPSLEQGTPYNWTVQTWTKSKNGSGDVSRSWCRSMSSQPATFVTSLFERWSPFARFVGIGGNTQNTTFVYLRKELAPNVSDLKSAVGFITARLEPQLLCGYRLYIHGDLVNVGPGRGEAPVWGGDGTFQSLPYSTLDLTPAFLQAGGKNHTAVVIAIQAMQYKHAPSVMMQLHLFFRNATMTTVVTDDMNWIGFNGDVHRKPGPPQHGSSAGTDFVEYLDARNEPAGWMLPGFNGGSDWDIKLTAVKPTPSDWKNLHAKMEPPLELSSIGLESLNMVAVPINHTLSQTYTTFIADFGKEFQGGLRLQVDNGTSGQTVHIACGESIGRDTSSVGDTWGWEFDWILRDGSQLLEQHKYMECRYVSLTFVGILPPSLSFSLSAWKVHYPWDEADSTFHSSDSTLDAIWDLCRYTVEAASLDTYTDSNTRERLPYEADGMVAASARLLVQRDYLWARHSHAYVLQHPTWPVEWKQLSPLLGWQDYMATGQVDLALAFMDELYNRTMIGFLDSELGLLETSGMGTHIVDWMPEGVEADQTVERHEFTASNHTSVSNMFAAHGLDLLAQLMEFGGRTSDAKRFAAQANILNHGIVKHMWNGTAFCDGVCSEVGGNSLVMTNMFALCLGMVPQEHISSAWDTVADWGLEQMGDYGAFWYQTALSGSYFAPLYETPDDGSAMYKALTKCDQYSWCSGLRGDGLTMTRESWHDGTYSHPWGASAIVGIVWGIMGIHQTSPGFATFSVKPKLGSLSHASVTVPTLYGHITVLATRTLLEVQIPCNSMAMLCLPRSTSLHDPSNTTIKQEHSLPTKLLLDGETASSSLKGGHLCANEPVSCGRLGASRRLLLVEEDLGWEEVAL